jgi:hypothetical protein
MGVVLTVLFVVLLWAAAVAFATDSRDGRDWFSRGNADDRSPRLGD